MSGIKKQGVTNTFLSYIGAFLGYLIVYFQPYFIHAEDIGLVRILYSFAFVSSTLMSLGFSNFILRYFPKIKSESTKNHGLFGLIIWINIVGFLLVFSILLALKSQVFSYYNYSDGLTTYYFHAILTGLVISISLILSIYCNCLFRTTYMVFLNEVFTRILQFVVLFAFYFGWINHESFIIGNLMVYFLQLLLIAIYFIRLKLFTFKVDWSFFNNLNTKDLIFSSVLMTLTSFISLSARFVDQLQIAHFLNQAQVGIYSTCIIIPMLLEIPLRNIERIAQPKLAHYWENKQLYEINSLYKKSSKYLFFVGSLLFLVLISGVDLLFSFLPKEYLIGKLPMIIIAISILFNLLSGINSAIVVVSHKYYILTIGLVLQLALQLVLNNIMVPIYGINGAAFSTLIGFVFFNCMMLFYNYIRFKIHPFSKSIGVIFLGLTFLLSIHYTILINLNSLIRISIEMFLILILFSFLSYRFKIIEEVNVFLNKYILKSK